MYQNTVIRYREVERVESQYIRYAAFLETEEGNESNKGAEQLSVERWANLMSEGRDLDVKEITDVIKAVPFQAVFFETKGVSPSTATKQFEFVLVNAPNLHKFCESEGPDLTSFAKYLSQPSANENTNNDYCCTFANLSGDAQLIVPKWDLKSMQVPLHQTMPPPSAFTHLASFLRQASMVQIVSVWKMVASQYFAAISNTESKDERRPVWLSTSGMGVSYLHFRLDKRPKYYTFKEFAKET